MVAEWQPRTYYRDGNVVNYQGFNYRIIHEHESQPNWPPPSNPGLWSRDFASFQPTSASRQPPSAGFQPPSGAPPDHADAQYGAGFSGGFAPSVGDSSYGGGSFPQPQTGFPQPQTYGGGGYDQPQTHGGGYDQPQLYGGGGYDQPLPASNASGQEHRGVGATQVGGVSAGAALIASGFELYKHNRKTQHQRDAETHALTNWITSARKRTDEYNRNGPSGPTTWVLTEGKKIPPYAIVGGHAQGQPLYIARVFIEGGVHNGKASPILAKGAAVPYDGLELDFATYEILIGNENAVKWVKCKGHPKNLGAQPVEGGREANGDPLYIVQVEHKQDIHPGKGGPKWDIAMYGYGYQEKTAKEYKVLVYA